MSCICDVKNLQLLVGWCEKSRTYQTKSDDWDICEVVLCFGLMQSVFFGSLVGSKHQNDSEWFSGMETEPLIMLLDAMSNDFHKQKRKFSLQETIRDCSRLEKVHVWNSPIFEIPRIEIYRDCTVLVWLRWVGPQKWGHLTTQPVVVSSIDVFCRKSLMFPYVPIVSRVFPYVPIKNGDVPMKTWWIDHEKSERPGPLWWLGSGGNEGLEIWKFMGIYILFFHISSIQMFTYRHI